MVGGGFKRRDERLGTYHMVDNMQFIHVIM